MTSCSKPRAARRKMDTPEPSYFGVYACNKSSVLTDDDRKRKRGKEEEEEEEEEDFTL
jgi:hypothetical protein